MSVWSTRWWSSAVAQALVAAATVLHPRAGAAQENADARRELFESIRWTDGPATGRLGARASIPVPQHCRFTGSEGARTFLEVTQNPAGGDELGLLLCKARGEEHQSWFVVFSFDESGYVRDDEKTRLDAEKILARLREGNEAGNAERRERGWEPLTLEGWVKPPYYDAATNNLTWSTRVSVPSGDASVNHSVRLLGRSGVMHVELVADPGDLAAITPAFDSVVRAHTFLAGQRYAEWREGDKVAKYGLTALVAGGAGAAAAKLGLFGKLWKLVLTLALALKKLLVVAVVAVGGAIKALFSRRKTTPADTPAAS